MGLRVGICSASGFCVGANVSNLFEHQAAENDREWHEARAGHSFPNTLDGADSSFPPLWDWRRDRGTWYAIRDRGVNHEEVVVGDNCDKIGCLYALSRLAWKEEAVVLAALGVRREESV